MHPFAPRSPGEAANCTTRHGAVAADVKRLPAEGNAEALRSLGRWNRGDLALWQRGAKHADAAAGRLHREKAAVASPRARLAAAPADTGGGSGGDGVEGSGGESSGRHSGDGSRGDGGGLRSLLERDPAAVAVLDTWALTPPESCGAYGDWVHHPRLAFGHIEAWMTSVLGRPCSL